ncbi:mobile mystery protein A [Candidatus Poribacteria bacterium]|nr:mobile mystery protein A [Candidatus Poribacteria bacterium]
MEINKLQLNQLEAKLKVFSKANQIAVPPTGWIKAVRVTLGMSLQQLADKLSITKQSVRDMEIREQKGSVTLKSLREAAHALDMELVYGLAPKDGSIDKLIERKALDLAKEIVLRTSGNMRLEDQENSKRRLKKAIDERAAIIKDEMPRMLWD